MKKIVFVLVLLLFAAPAWATTVTIDACDIGGGQVEISYVTDANLPRAFGLDITVTNGNITACEPNMTGECTVSVRGFGIFPGTIVIEADGTVSDYNTPVAPSDDPGALGGLDTNGITIEMGSLYVDGNAPPLEGVLCTITVTENCTVNIAGNAARCGTGSDARGVVMENPGEVPIVDYVSGAVTLGCTCEGEVTDDNKVTIADAIKIVGDLNNYGVVIDFVNTIPKSDTAHYSECGDANNDDKITIADAIKIVGWLNNYGVVIDFVNTIPCDHSYP